MQLQSNICTVMLADEFPEMGYKSPQSLGGPGVSLMIYVERVDDTFKKVCRHTRELRREPLSFAVVTRSVALGKSRRYLMLPFVH